MSPDVRSDFLTILTVVILNSLNPPSIAARKNLHVVVVPCSGAWCARVDPCLRPARVVHAGDSVECKSYSRVVCSGVRFHDNGCVSICAIVSNIQSSSIIDQTCTGMGPRYIYNGPSVAFDHNDGRDHSVDRAHRKDEERKIPRRAEGEEYVEARPR